MSEIPNYHTRATFSQNRWAVILEDFANSFRQPNISVLLSTVISLNNIIASIPHHNKAKFWW
jgi:hypothetical protein